MTKTMRLIDPSEIEGRTRSTPEFRLENAKRAFLKWNAAQPDRCQSARTPACPFDETDRGDLSEKWCCHFELTLMIRCVRRIIHRWGAAGAKRSFPPWCVSGRSEDTRGMFPREITGPAGVGPARGLFPPPSFGANLNRRTRKHDHYTRSHRPSAG